MTPIPLRPNIARWLHDAHADAATRLREQASGQRARAARESDPMMRDAQEAGASMVDGWADDEDNAARRWATMTT